VGSIQLGDGNQLKVSITGGGAGDFEEEVVIKSLLPDRGTGLNVIANGNPSDAVSIRLFPSSSMSEAIGLVGLNISGGLPYWIFQYGDSARPIAVRWLEGENWKPSIVFYPQTNGSKTKNYIAHGYIVVGFKACRRVVYIVLYPPRKAVLKSLKGSKK